MADKKLESITFPDLPDRYVVKPDIADVTGLQTALDSKASKTDVYNSFATDTAQGSIASFDDGADDIPVKSLTVDIVPVQSGSGDPSPNNVRAISGWTEANISVSGINIWDEVSESGYYDIADGTAKSGGTWKRSKNAIHCVPNTTYCFARSGSGSFGALLFYDANDNYIGYTSSLPDGLFTTPSNAYYIRFYTSTLQYDISINYPSTDTSYHAYHGHTVTIPLGNTYYGGVLDVVSGVLTVTHDKEVFDGTQGSWQVYNGAFYRSFTGYKRGSYGLKNAISDKFANSGQNGGIQNLIDSGRGHFALRADTENIQFYPVDDTITTSDGFNTWLTSNNVSVVYELATPQTVQLTPSEVKTLLGNNNIWADTGDIDLTYRADLGLYLDKIINA